jgi:hypothetical protein
MPKQRVKTEQEKDKKRNRRMNRRHQINKRRCNRRTSWYTGQTLGTVRWTDGPLFSSVGTSCIRRARKTVAPDDPAVWVGTPSVYPMLSLNSYKDVPRRSLQHRMIRRLGQDEASVYPMDQAKPLTLGWMPTIIQTPPRSNSPLFDLLFTFSPFGLIYLKPLVS